MKQLLVKIAIFGAGVLSCVLLLHAYPAPAGGNDVARRPEVNVIKQEASEITDALIRDALLSFLDSCDRHTSPQSGVGNVDEVFQIYRDSHRLYCFFRGYQVQHTGKVAEQTVMTVKNAYRLALDRLAWIPERKITDSQLDKCYKSVSELFGELAADCVVNASSRLKVAQ